MNGPKLGFVALFVAATLVTLEQPAAAHGVSGVQPSNYQTRVLSVSDPLPGLTLRAVDLGTRLELRNASSREVEVLGYEGEPYLRIGPRGVFQNERSPAVYLNRSQTLSEKPPPSRFSADAPPKWQRLSSAHTARWHDHRAHWMASTDPPIVQRAPGSPHVVQRFTIDLRVDGAPLLVRGVIRWVPGPTPWPTLAGALAVALGIFLGSRTAWWAWVLGSATALLIALEVVHIAGLFGATTASAMSTLWASGFSLSGILIGLIALAWLVRRGAYAAVPLVLFTGMVIGMAGGLADLTALWRSQVPSTLSPETARLIVGGVLGLGAALVASSVFRLRPPRPSRAEALGASVPSVPSVRQAQPM